MKKNERAAAIVRTIVVSLIAVLFVVPLVWMVLSSLKTAPEVFARPFHWLPARVQWQNYATVWMNEEASMLRAFANTLYIAVQHHRADVHLLPGGLFLCQDQF